MKTIILAAGYATRLYPLTLSRAKPLLNVAHKPIIEHLLEKLPLENGEAVYIVTNEKFKEQFERWARSFESLAAPRNINLQITSDGTSSDAGKLGAIGDLSRVLNQRKIKEGILVAAGDNIFSHSLTDFRRFAEAKDAPVLGVYDVGGAEATKKFNAIEVNDENQIIFFEEKPVRPKSSLTGIALYYYPKSVLPKISEYVREKNNTDQPGRLIEWLYKKMTVYACLIPGIWFDIGTKESLIAANRIFRRLESGP